MEKIVHEERRKKGGEWKTGRMEERANADEEGKREERRRGLIQSGEGESKAWRVEGEDKYSVKRKRGKCKKRRKGLM